jgi:hypothetical protein
LDAGHKKAGKWNQPAVVIPAFVIQQETIGQAAKWLPAEGQKRTGWPLQTHAAIHQSAIINA